MFPLRISLECTLFEETRRVARSLFRSLRPCLARQQLISKTGVCLAFFLIACGFPDRVVSAPPQSAELPRAIELEPSQAWFEVYEILPGVYSIREPGHWERVISYLIVGTERALLFDSGTGIGDMRAVVSALTALPIVVVNSHSHADHIGGNYQFDLIYSVDSETTKDSARGKTVEESQRFVPLRAFSQDPPPTFLRETYRILPFQISHYLEDGDVIDLGARRLEVIFTPGHAADALCLIDREHRLIFTGDTFYLGRLFVQAEPASLATYATSVARLAALAGDVERILPAHSATLLQAFFLTRLGEALSSIERGDADALDIGEQRKEFRFQNFSIVVPEVAFSDSGAGYTPTER